MYRLWRWERRIITFVTILLGVLIVLFGVVLFFYPEFEISPLKCIGIGLIITIVGLVLKRIEKISFSDDFE